MSKTNDILHKLLEELLNSCEDKEDDSIRSWKDSKAETEDEDMSDVDDEEGDDEDDSNKLKKFLKNFKD